MSEGLNYLVREAAGQPEGALVLFHGRGADEHDLFPLLDLLDPGRALLGVTPRGPLSLPPGGAHWYVVHRVGFPDASTFWPTYERTSSWLDGLLDERGIPIGRTVIGGFSQGAVMSYSLALGKDRPSPCALVALSGFIPEVEGFSIDLGRNDLPVAIGHGTLDPVIPVEFARSAWEVLRNAGFEVFYRESEMPHTIHPAFIRDLAPWVREALARAPRWHG